MAQKCFKKVLSSVIGLVWFGNNSKNEFSIPKNIEKDPLHTHMAQKMNKRWFLKALVGFGMMRISTLKSAYP